MTVIPRVHVLFKNGRAVFLAYDHGLEVGPSSFNTDNVNPEYVIDIALEAHFDGVVLHHGIAEKYYHNMYRDVPLIVKLNGKSSLTKMSPFSMQLCDVERAIHLGGKAVGYNVYEGSDQEPTMFKEFSKIVQESHDMGIPVVGWMYSREENLGDNLSADMIAYNVRIGLELGADILIVKFNGDVPGFRWIVKNAGRAKILVAIDFDKSDEDFLKTIENVMETGVSGVIVGRKIWQSQNPFSLSKAVMEIVHERKSFEEVKHYLTKED